MHASYYAFALCSSNFTNPNSLFGLSPEGLVSCSSTRLLLLAKSRMRPTRGAQTTKPDVQHRRWRWKLLLMNKPRPVAFPCVRSTSVVDPFRTAARTQSVPIGAAYRHSCPSLGTTTPRKCRSHRRHWRRRYDLFPTPNKNRVPPFCCQGFRSRCCCPNSSSMASSVLWTDNS